MDVNDEIEQLKASIAMKVDDEHMIAIMEELDKRADRSGYLKEIWESLSRESADEDAKVLEKHGITIIQEIGVRNVVDERSNKTMQITTQRGWSLARTINGVQLKSGRAGAWIPINHSVPVPFTNREEAMRAALQYATVLENQAAYHRVPVKQVVVRMPMATDYNGPDTRINVTVNLDREDRRALESLLAGLKAGNYETKIGHRVDTYTHAVRWLIEHIAKAM